MILAMLGCDRPPRPVPRITLLGPSEFAATAYRGQFIEHMVQLKNSGTAELIVEPVTGCACLATIANSSRIPPGGLGTLKMSVDTQYLPEGYVAPIAVLIRTNDPVSPAPELHVKATVISEVVASLRAIDFGRVAPNQSASVEVTLAIRPESKTKILSVRSSDPTVEAILETQRSKNKANCTGTAAPEFSTRTAFRQPYHLNV